MQRFGLNEVPEALTERPAFGMLHGMMRRRFLCGALGAVGAVGAGPLVAPAGGRQQREASESRSRSVRPLALTMWDFSWLERRWPGAGFEDWDRALDELVERGYDAVRIDAYPHLVAEDPEREYTLIPVWNQCDWGSPALTRVTVQPGLNTFLAKCRDRGVAVGLSTWYRQDTDDLRMRITTPARMAEIWLRTLDSIAADGLLDTVLYVDMCNEWPGDLWAPFFVNDPPEQTWGYWHTGTSMKWMRETLAAVREHHPDLPLCFSMDGDRPEYYVERDLSFMDLIEHHVWMAKENGGEYYALVGYKYDRFSPESFEALVANGERVYRELPDYWTGLLRDKIRRLAASAAKARLPLATSECWGLVDYKDWPLLDWSWVKELCAIGVTEAARTGRWVATATSNFCAPQFRGIWRDVAWHREVTRAIKTAEIDPELNGTALVRRLSTLARQVAR